MKLTIEGPQQEYFRRHGVIEFEGLLSSKQIEELNLGIDSALSQRLNMSSEALVRQQEALLLLNGRDLWRDQALVKKYVTGTHLGKIASQLIDESPLRIGYDQLFQSTSHASLLAKENAQLVKFLEQPRSLEEISCLQGLALGILIRLTPANEEPLPLQFPQQKGNVVFISPQLPLNYELLYRDKNQRFLLIVYTEDSAQYLLKENDPHTHSLKKWGYVFGDSLDQKRNPIVFR